MFRKILYGTDFSRASRPAFRHAVSLARQSGAKLLITHVVPSVGILDVEATWQPRIRAGIEKAMRDSAGKRLAALVAQARKSHVAAQPLLLSGRADEAMTRTAKRTRVDLIVIGTHGHSGLERAVLGSVASKVVCAAPCPVLTVRSRRRTTDAGR